MKAHTASLINALVLVAFSAWAYVDIAMASFTALIPGVFGLLLLACYPGVKAHNKIIAHIAVILTIVVILGLYTPLTGALERGDGLATARVGAMMLTSVVALVFFVKSFIDARRKKA